MLDMFTRLGPGKHRKISSVISTGQPRRLKETSKRFIIAGKAGCFTFDIGTRHAL